MTGIVHEWPDGLPLQAEPEKDHIWAAVEVFAEELDRVDERPSHPRRDLWYAPTVTIRDAYRIDALCRVYGIDRVADLGAGDCRLALWFDRRGYDVAAYELNADLVDAVTERFHLGDINLRMRDYYGDYADLVGPGTAVVAFGGTNELPYIPESGLAVQGYWESGVTAYHDGEVIARW